MSAAPQTEAPKLYVVPAGPEVVFEVDAAPPLIPDAEYSALCCGTDVKVVFSVAKVFIRFRIVEGPHEGTIVAFPCRARGQKKGDVLRVKLARRGKLFRMLCRVLALPVKVKPHHVSHRELVNKLCRIKTRTVKTNDKQKPLNPAEFYSVVDDVLCVEAG